MTKYPYTDDKGITHYNKEIAYKDKENKIYLFGKNNNPAVISIFQNEDGFIIETNEEIQIFKTNSDELHIYRPVESEIELKYIGPVQKEDKIIIPEDNRVVPPGFYVEDEEKSI